MVTVRFFASIKEKVGLESIDIPVNGPASIRDILNRVADETSVDKAILMPGGFLYALNQQMESLDTPVNDGDEIAVLPPLSGGF
ncbi:hypothetical protein MNBD_NITROSPINAE01-1960 [hydrothermal vent metagenome]|uniref:Molybdopterin synthase sulfur carrier subunit n=1 Tax=hydrothermal vent metagenome TaxID=652676 RepID=A0A3B1C4K2_9ZZZZ